LFWQIGGTGHVVWTVVVVFGTLFLIYLASRCLSPNWYLHVHHYFALPLLIPVARYDNVAMSLFVSAFFAAQVRPFAPVGRSGSSLSVLLS
jgi:hypothetical protein